jgi:hypothetical protein
MDPDVLRRLMVELSLAGGSSALSNSGVMLAAVAGASVATTLFTQLLMRIPWRRALAFNQRRLSFLLAVATAVAVAAYAQGSRRSASFSGRPVTVVTVTFESPRSLDFKDLRRLSQNLRDVLAEALSDFQWIVIEPASFEGDRLEQWRRRGVVRMLEEGRLDPDLVLRNRAKLVEGSGPTPDLVLLTELERNRGNRIEPLRVYLKETGNSTDESLLLISLTFDLLRRLRNHHELGLSPREDASAKRRLLALLERHLLAAQSTSSETVQTIQALSRSSNIRDDELSAFLSMAIGGRNAEERLESVDRRRKLDALKLELGSG